MVKMGLEKAVSTTDSNRDRYCLLRDDEIETYRCVETAANLGAMAEETRLLAYWHHFQTHVVPYTKWAASKKLFDPTMRYPDPYEGAAELVEEVLLSFCKKIQEKKYDVQKGLPCKYIKRAAKNKFQDILRRGHNPTREECIRCYEIGGFCPASKAEQPGERERQRCFRLPFVEEFDAVSITFAAAGLQEQWPPVLQDVQSLLGIHRPVEAKALQDVLLESIWNLAARVLKADPTAVLKGTFRHHKSSREIAEELKTTPGNVDQIRHRGLRRLRKLIK